MPPSPAGSTGHGQQSSVEESIRFSKVFRRSTKTIIVKYDQDAIVAYVKLSNRYIQDRFLPDKAIDLLDEAGSRRLDVEAVDQRRFEKIDEAEKQKQDAQKKEDCSRLLSRSSC